MDIGYYQERREKDQRVLRLNRKPIQLKVLEPYLLFTKRTKKIPLCCHIFFEYVNKTLRSTIPEYQNAEIHNKKDGILLCPECIINKITERYRN